MLSVAQRFAGQSGSRLITPAINRVNPLDIMIIEQIHRVGGSPGAMPINPDLL